jgi:hypothetical protein
MDTSCDAEMSVNSDGISTTEQEVSLSSVAVFLDKLISGKASPSAVRTEDADLPRILQRFDSSKIPQISLVKYLERLRNLGRCRDSSLLVALIYIDRILAAHSNFALTERNVHRLFLTCTIVGEKFTNDDVYVNSFYAGVGGVNLEEMNRLEAILLNVLTWRLGVSPEEYDKKQREVRQSFTEALSVARTKGGGSWKEWIVLQEAMCETQREAVCVNECSPAESSMQASASTISGSTISCCTISDSTTSGDSESVSDASEATGLSPGVA